MGDGGWFRGTNRLLTTFWLGLLAQSSHSLSAYHLSVIASCDRLSGLHHPGTVPPMSRRHGRLHVRATLADFSQADWWQEQWPGSCNVTILDFIEPKNLCIDFTNFPI